MKIWKRVPLLLIIIAASMLAASLLAMIGIRGVYGEYHRDGWSQPAVSALMQGLSDHVYPWDSGKKGSGDDPLLEPGTEAVPETQEESGSSDGVEPVSEVRDELPEEPETYEYTEVSRDYFDDALFIGDSRVVGVQLYSGWDNVTYYAEEGLTIYNMFDREIVEENGKKISVEKALKNHSFGKIYLEIGINEMGTGTIDSFMNAYEEAVTHLRELQPDAIIFVCGIMYVKQSRSETDPIFNNSNIQKRNDRIVQLADQKNIFYLDINEIVADESGNLNPDYTWDEVHLLGKYDVLWMEYFSKHGIVKDKK